MYIAYGTYKLPRSITSNQVYSAIKIGYRHIDTAFLYKNEVETGIGINKAISNNIIVRSDITVTTKLWIKGMSTNINIMENYVMQSLNNINIGYIDRLLLHFPTTDFVMVYSNLVHIQQKYPNLIKNIGVSNFKEEHLLAIYNAIGVYPSVNQIEVNPLLRRYELISFCKKNNILVEGHSIFMGGSRNLLDNSEILALAKGSGHNLTVFDVIIIYCKQLGISIIIGSSTVSHIVDNFNSYYNNIVDGNIIIKNKFDDNDNSIYKKYI